jgi:hypothetical protein
VTAWAPFLDECTRVLRPGGILRLSEPTDFGHTSSAAFNHIGALVMQAFCRAGYAFSPDGLFFGVDHALPTFLRQRGYRQVQSWSHIINFSAKMEAWADNYHNIEIIGYQSKALLIKLGLITAEDFDQLHQQALIDMMDETFAGLGYLITVLG